MKSALGPLVVLGLACGALAGVAAPSPAAADTASAAASTTAPRVLHRIVWEQRTGQGIRVYSAERDGRDRRPVYRSRRGLVHELSLDRRGRRVAFAPCCRAALPRIVVAPVNGGPARFPLAHHPEFFDVGGIGWSPDGSRLAFEGLTHVHHPELAIYSVRLDGSDLHKILDRPSPRTVRGTTNAALAWTREGVLYGAHDNLRAAIDGRSHVVLRDVEQARISGDGRTLVTLRDRHLRPAWWIGRSDGTHQHRWQSIPRRDGRLHLMQVVPDFHARHLLSERTRTDSVRHSTWIRWRFGTGFEDATVLGFLHRVRAYTWN